MGMIGPGASILVTRLLEMRVVGAQVPGGVVIRWSRFLLAGIHGEGSVERPDSG